MPRKPSKKKQQTESSDTKDKKQEERICMCTICLYLGQQKRHIDAINKKQKAGVA